VDAGDAAAVQTERVNSLWVTLVLLGALILLNAGLAGSEIALISLREGQLRYVERTGTGAGRALVRLVRNPNRFLATIQVGITLAGFLASATAAVTIAERLAPLLDPLGRAAEPIAIAVVTVVLSFFTLVFGELAPKRLAMQFALPWALLVARPLDVLAGLSRPVVWGLGAATDLIVRLFGGDPETGQQQLTPDELRDLVAGHRGLNQEQRTIIMGAMEIHERILRRVLVPRGSVFTVPVTSSLDQARRDLASSGHSRAPVVGPDGLDDVLGVVSLRDLLAARDSVTEVCWQPVVWPDTVRVSDALRRFRAERQQFALVVDEHGSVTGIVTLEDLLEEIVGEIYDEADRDILSVLAGPDGTLNLPGTFPVHDLPDLGVEFTERPRGDYTTIAGLTLALLGRIPERPGDTVDLEGWTLEVASVQRRAITGIVLRPRS
jgi:putative hemolysin